MKRLYCYKFFSHLVQPYANMNDQHGVNLWHLISPQDLICYKLWQLYQEAT